MALNPCAPAWVPPSSLQSSTLQSVEIGREASGGGAVSSAVQSPHRGLHSGEAEMNFDELFCNGCTVQAPQSLASGLSSCKIVIRYEMGKA